MSVLLLASGALHLAVAALGAPESIRAPLAVFGAVYAALGLWIRGGSRASVIAALAAALTGLGLGGSNYLQNGGPMTLPLMFAIDIAVVAAGGLWLMKSGKSG